MLKLMKYEFIHSVRTFMIAFAIFLGVCFIVPFFIGTSLFNEEMMAIFPILLSIGFTVLVIGICIALFVSIFTNYYRSMFQKPAYLTMTLPVSSLQLIVSKLIMSIVWLIIGGIVLMSGFIMMMVLTLVLEGNADFSHFWDGFGSFVSHLVEGLISDPMHVVEMILMVVSSLIYIVITIYFSLTITHTKWLRKHRLLFGLIFYFVFNSIIDYVMNSIFGVMYMNVAPLKPSLVFILIDILLVLGTVYILDNHIEIE